MLSSCFLCYDQTNAVNENTAILLFACSATSATLVGIFFLCVSVCVCVKIFSTGLSMVSREVADAAVAHSESGVNVLVSVWLMIGLKKKCLTPVRKSKIIASAKCKMPCATCAQHETTRPMPKRLERLHSSVLHLSALMEVRNLEPSVLTPCTQCLHCVWLFPPR